MVIKQLICVLSGDKATLLQTAGASSDLPSSPQQSAAESPLLQKVASDKAVCTTAKSYARLHS